MSKKYRMGKRFQKVLTMGILAEIAVLVVAYFVYDWLLGEWIPSLTGGPLLAIFGSIGILAVWCTNKFLRRFNENYWYEVTEKGLRMNRGQTARFYPWEDFKGARVNRFSFLSALPVIFDMTNGPMELDRSLEDSYGLTMEEVQHYVSLIRTLEPYPTAAFGGGESAGFIVPDLEFYCKDGQWGVRVQDRWSSGVPYSSYYDLSGTDAAPELRTYLQEQHRHADYIVQCVEKRRSTLQQLGQLILNTQLAFLAEGQPLHTLTADMLAEQMGVNPSTVSRAIKGKYVKTPTKVYPLSYFLTRAGNRSGDAAPDSRSEILAALHKLLQEEDPVHPLSDAQLADQLTAQGITTTRRTVAKYRLLLGIPGAFERKQ